MLMSLGLIFIGGYIVRILFNKMNIPALMGYIFLGIILGPSVFNVLSEDLLTLSADLREIMLIIIITRAGLALNLSDLKAVGRPAILLSFVPATFEIAGSMLLGPWLLGLTLTESALLGAVLAAVSPAVIVPRMVDFIHGGSERAREIPQLVLAGASLDDIYALVVFSAVLSLLQNSTINVMSFVQLPVSILSGIAVGAVVGFVLLKLFDKWIPEAIYQGLILFGISLILVALESQFENIPYSGILAVMASAAVLKFKGTRELPKLQSMYETLWKPGEILLFVLVGALVNISFAFSAGWMPVLLVLGALVVRLVGVFASLLKTSLTVSEKKFVAISSIPKATVQAAIGGVPLALGLPAGEIILTTSVIAILLTAPIGAFLIDQFGSKLLNNKH